MKCSECEATMRAAWKHCTVCGGKAHVPTHLDTLREHVERGFARTAGKGDAAKWRNPWGGWLNALDDPRALRLRAAVIEAAAKEAKT